MKQRESIIKIMAVVMLLVIALTSFFALAGYATDADNYSHTIEAIDEKKATVMGFTATAAAASTAIAAIPGDASTPIANQIMEISEYLFIVVCFLVLEKSLLTVLGFLSFKVLIPVGCVLLTFWVLWRRRGMLVLGLKFVVFSLVIAMIVPLSVNISDMIYDANRSTIEGISQEIELMESEGEDIPATEPEEEKNWLDNLKDLAGSAIDKVETAVTNTGEEARELLNKFIDAIALFIITYCAIPVVVVFVVIWLVKFLFSITIPVPNPDKLRHRRSAAPEDKELTPA